jgi:protocatechuate 4,5-dioxygenase, alpha chain
MPMSAVKETAAAKGADAEKEYDDIPGTFVFDADRSREGYHLNMFCMSLMKAENRKAFKANEANYLKRFPMTPEQRDAILKRDYNRMLELGGNIYFTAKLGATDGHSFQHMAAVMTGSTQEDYAKMMLAGGRSVEGNRSKSGRDLAAPAASGKASIKARAASKTTASGKASSAKSAGTPSSQRGNKAGSKKAEPKRG